MEQNKIKSNDLPPKRAQAASLLATGVPIVEIASQLGVSPGTVHQWKKSKAFQAYRNRVVSEIIDDTLHKVTSTRHLAIEALAGILIDPQCSPLDKIKAAIAVLDQPGLQPPDPRTCSVEGLAELEKEANMDPLDLLSEKFNLS